jgi:serine/threonine-protein kinase
MHRRLTCPQGHQWQLSAAGTVLPGQRQVPCPVCGAAVELTASEVEAARLTLLETWRSHQPAADGGDTRRTLADGPNAPTPPPVVSGYEILEVLGHGGMGVVYKARQVGLKRLVALKMILAGKYARPQDLARFRTEAEAVACLQHPNIVQIYEVGEQDGHPYFSLEFVNGGSLDRKLHGQALPVRHAAQVLEALARAMHYAHQHGIVHRDLKPSNVLLTAEGTPKVTDFGLAKRLHSESGQTRSGDIMGTPGYMAPEQAEGKGKDAGPATDVYALGAILYELLTGRPPFQGKTMLDTLHQVKTEEPVPPARLQPRVPRDLQTICLTCLHKEPDKRYPTAEALAEDLRAFLAGEQIRARPAGAWQQLVQWARRRPGVALLLGAGGVAVVGLLVGGWLYNALAVGCVAVVSLLVAGWWYNARLQAALRQIEQQQTLAERQVERLHLLLETTRRLVSASDLNTLLRLLTETTTLLANAERATIYLVDPDRRELWSKVALGDGVGEIRLAFGVGIAGTVAVTGETVNIADAYADPRFNPEIDRRTGYQTRNILAFPMAAQQGRILGVFQVLNKRTGPFQAEDVELLSLLAASAAVAVENAQRPTVCG